MLALGTFSTICPIVCFYINRKHCFIFLIEGSVLWQALLFMGLLHFHFQVFFVLFLFCFVLYKFIYLFYAHSRYFSMFIFHCLFCVWIGNRVNWLDPPLPLLFLSSSMFWLTVAINVAISSIFAFILGRMEAKIDDIAIVWYY